MRLRASRTFTVEPALPAALEPLRALCRNVYWTWNTDAASLFERLDRRLWERTNHNPVRVLQLMQLADLERLATDHGFIEHLQRVEQAFGRYMARAPQLTVAGTSRRHVIAYFSLEFALTESLPNYSGGLGVLAGDHLKSASDLGLPLVGVGLFYRQGYFQQVLAPDGWQNEEYQDLDTASQPLHRVRDAAGHPLTVAVPIDTHEVRAAVWRVDVGQASLFLLDTDLDENTPEDRRISSRLYGGDIETRIQQEIVLGIGGVRALHAMDLHPAVCHMNEGHSALLGVERIRMLMEETGTSYDEARLPVTAATVFTTHTAVAAGIDLFSPDVVRKYLANYYTRMGLDDRTFIGLGRLNPGDEREPFSMALLGLRLSGFRNGVSQLHRSVSRHLWEGAWPALPFEQVPIEGVTNGVHLPTWVSHDLAGIYDTYVGPGWRDDPVRPEAWQHIHEVPDSELWEARGRQRERLVHRARRQHSETSAHGGGRASTGEVLDTGVLTVGFARRFAGYKRATLLFRDPERLARIVNSPQRPVQFIFAGKAHPRDEPGKQLIREVVTHSRRPEFRDRLVVLERYDVELARSLVQGCDVWLNTPLRPLEASGTSGMKAVANGALHLSVMDGWWAEAHRPGLGWAIGRDRVDDDPEVQDAFDAESLYSLLEEEVAPAFYDRDADGVPSGWVGRMKRSIAAFAPEFSTHRMVSDYARRAYTPAAERWLELRGDDVRGARELAAWLARVRDAWHEVKVCAVEDDLRDGSATSAVVSVRVQIHPGRLAPADVSVDLVHGRAGPNGELEAEAVTPMAYEGTGEDGVCRYVCAYAPVESGRVGYAVRVLPGHPGLRNAADLGLVHWA
jgi:starch phosphorylase